MFQVRHRWCELVVKHTHAKAYKEVENFLLREQVNTHFETHHQASVSSDHKWTDGRRTCVPKAMGVYLYGELMVREDPRQQALARRCLSLVREEMDQSARRVVEEMVL